VLARELILNSLEVKYVEAAVSKFIEKIRCFEVNTLYRNLFALLIRDFAKFVVEVSRIFDTRWKVHEKRKDPKYITVTKLEYRTERQTKKKQVTVETTRIEKYNEKIATGKKIDKIKYAACGCTTTPKNIVVFHSGRLVGFIMILVMIELCVQFVFVFSNQPYVPNWWGIISVVFFVIVLMVLIVLVFCCKLLQQ